MTDDEMIVELRKRLETDLSRLINTPKVKYSEEGIKLISDNVSAHLKDVADQFPSAFPCPTGYNAADCRALGWIVEDSVPDCAELWCYGMKVVRNQEEPTEADKAQRILRGISMQFIDPYFEYVTFTGTIKL